MSTFEPPTVLTRPPPSHTPDLPPSPAPSRDFNGICSPYRDSRSPAPERITPEPISGHKERTEAKTQLSSKVGKQSKNAGGESRWRELMKEWKLFLTLENSGSVARDHLASERTFLAYTRTSLTLASTGVALVQLFTLSAAATDKDLKRFSRPLGAVMIVLGLIVLAVGVARYFLVQNALIRGTYPVARVSISFFSFALLVLVLAVFTIIIVAR